ncbi:hypothetical protein N9K06_01760, partial [Omnitrophica bacterium]|nr:hypothetical protein [Candidatus Omnitrophota bacterium]
RIEETVRSMGFEPVLVGGVYMLQGKLAELLASSLVSGLILLTLIFVIMGWLISRSVQTTVSLLLSMSLIPVAMLGLVGMFKIPLDIISAPAANLAMGMGVDAMIHMLIFVSARIKNSPDRQTAWMEATCALWRPILFSMFIVCCGFAIFGLSNFPPTQRFGLSVVLGTVMSPLAALFLLPYLASLRFTRK